MHVPDRRTTRAQCYRGQILDMDFFTRKDNAQRRTTYLIAMFAAAIFMIIGAVYCTVRPMIYTHTPLAVDWEFWDPQIFAIVASCVSLIILIGCLNRVFELRNGGR